MKDRTFVRGILITVAAFAVVLALLMAGLSQIDTRNASEQAASLKAAVLRAAVTCYAVEGRYPPNVAYLQANYGLTFDHDRFTVSIRAFADNILPDIAVHTHGEV